MDWITFGSSIGGTAILIGAASFVGKKWIGTRIEESVKHEYAKELEAHKAHLKTGLREAGEQKKADKLLYQKFLEILPSSGSINSLLNQKGVWEYRDDTLDQLWRFYDKWNQPECFFLDELIETKRKNLYDCINELLTYIRYNTFDLRDGFRGVPSEWEDTQPGRMEKTIIILDELSAKVILAHEDFISTARKKLLV